jgi:hypothetical protein
VPSIGAHHEIGSNFQRPFRHFRPHPSNDALFLNEFGDLGLHAQMEARIAPRLLGEKIEEVPLRHQRDETAARGQLRKIRERYAILADLAGELAHFLMRPLEELVEHAKLGHDSERRRVNGVAAEVAKEIGVFLQHPNVDAGTSEEIAQRHAGGAAPGDTTAGGDGFSWHRPDRQPPASAMTSR